MLTDTGCSRQQDGELIPKLKAPENSALVIQSAFPTSPLFHYGNSSASADFKHTGLESGKNQGLSSRCISVMHYFIK